MILIVSEWWQIVAQLKFGESDLASIPGLE